MRRVPPPRTRGGRSEGGGPEERGTDGCPHLLVLTGQVSRENRSLGFPHSVSIPSVNQLVIQQTRFRGFLLVPCPLPPGLGLGSDAVENLRVTKNASRPHDAHRPVTGKTWMQVCALPLTDMIPSSPSCAHVQVHIDPPSLMPTAAVLSFS